MVFRLDDRVKESSTSTGTGAFTLAGTSTGFQSFAEVGDGNDTYYVIQHQTDNQWEVGIGTYTAAGTSLSRDTILSSSNFDLAVNFSAGTKDVFIDLPSSRAVTGKTLVPDKGTLAVGDGSLWQPFPVGTDGQVIVADSAQTLGIKFAGAAAEWTDTGTLLHPADLSGAEDVVVGGTTLAGADIILGSTGYAIFNEQGSDVDFRIEGDTVSNLFFVDASADAIGVKTSTPTSGATLEVVGHTRLGRDAAQADLAGYAIADVNVSIGDQTTATSGSDIGISIGIDVQPTGNSSLFLVGSTVVIQYGTANNTGSSVGYGTYAHNDSDGTHGYLQAYDYTLTHSGGNSQGTYGVYGYSEFLSGSHTVSYGYSDFVFVDGATTTLTTRYGVYVGNPVLSAGGTLTNNYGIYIENQTAGSTIADAIFVAGGLVDFSASTTTLKIPVSAAPSVTANGHIALDTTVADFSHGVIKYFGGEEMGIVAMPIAQFTTPSDGFLVAYDATTDEFELVSPSAGSSEWTDNAGTLHPADSSGAQDVVIGGTTTANADTVFGSAGTVVFNEQGLSTADIRMEGDATTNLFFLDASADVIGINNATPTPEATLEVIGQTRLGYDATIDNPNYTPTDFNVQVADSFEDTTGTRFGLGVYLTQDPSGDGDAITNAIYAEIFTTTANDHGSAIAYDCVVEHDSAGQIDFVQGYNAGILLGGGNTILGTYGYQATTRVNAGTHPAIRGFVDDPTINGGTVTDRFAFYVENPTMGAATLTNNYGLYIDNQTSGATINSAIHVAGGLVDFSASTTTLKIPVSAAPSITANGHIALDTTVTDFSHGIIRYFGGEELFLVSMPVAQLSSPTDGYLVAYNATNDEFNLVSPTAGSSEWTDTGTVLHPADLSGAEDVVIGGTTAAGADIALLATGAAVFNEQGNDADFRVESDTTTHMIFVDASTNRVGIATDSPDSTFHAVGSTYPVVRGTRTSSQTNVSLAGLDFLHKTSADMTTGFGGAITLSIQDNTSAIIVCGDMSGVREGSDSLSGLMFRTYPGGTATERVRILQSGAVGVGTSSPDNRFHVELDDATTNAVTYPVRITHTTTGTPATNIGVGVQFEVETSASNNEVLASIDVSALDASAGSEDGAFVVKTMVAGSGTLVEGLCVVGRNVGCGWASPPDMPLHVEFDSGSTDIVSNVFRISRTSSGTPANGIGAAMEFEIETSASNNEVLARIGALAVDVTSTSEDGAILFTTMVSGSTTLVEGLRIVGPNLWLGDGRGISDESGNEYLFFNTTASAVNYVTITNSATGNAPTIKASGSDANISLDLSVTGSGNVRVNASNLLIGATAPPTAGGGKVLVFGDNAGDPTMDTNTAGIYAKDVAGTVEMYAVGEDDVATQISPHDPLTGEWIFWSQNLRTGKVLRVDMERFFREKFPEYVNEWTEAHDSAK